MSNDPYIQKLLDDYQVSLSMIEAHMEEHEQVFDVHRQLVSEYNRSAATLEAALKNVQEETEIGPFKRSSSVYRSVDTEPFVLAYRHAIAEMPTLIKAIDPKAVAVAVKAGILPENAFAFVHEERRFRTTGTHGKPKQIKIHPHD